MREQVENSYDYFGPPVTSLSANSTSNNKTINQTFDNDGDDATRDNDQREAYYSHHMYPHKMNPGISYFDSIYFIVVTMSTVFYADKY